MRLKLENTLKNCHQVGKSFAAFHNNCHPEMPLLLFLSSRTLHAEPVKILLAEHVGPSPNQHSVWSTKLPQSTPSVLSSQMCVCRCAASHLFCLLFRSYWSWRNSGLKCCATFWQDTTSRCPALVKPSNMWGIWKCTLSTRIYSIKWLIQRLLQIPGPKADRTGRPEGGRGQRCASSGGGKQHHNWR